MNITSASPSITQAEINLVTEAITIGWQDNRNMHLDQFTEEFASYIGRKYCLPVSHGTGAIHAALLALGVEAGDEVIVPDITWVASAAPITYMGATPVFVDIDATSWCLSASAFKRAITKKTKAVIIVDLFGNIPGEMEEIVKIARENNIAILEDAAEGLGATYKGKQAGSFGDIAIFSFSPTKLITSAQGGAVVTDNEELFEKCKLYAHHGISKKAGDRYFWSTLIGYNYNWTNIQAALALAQLRRINELLDKKKEIFHRYKEYLGGVEGVNLNATIDNVSSTYWISVAIISPKFGVDKEAISKACEPFGVDMRPFFYPISSMPPFEKLAKKNNYAELNKISYELSPYGVCLPSGNNLSVNDIKYVSDILKRVLSI